MKKISLLLIVALMALGAWAQEIKDGDTFFDGWNYYTAEVRHSGVIHFIDNESDEDFTIQKVDKKKGLVWLKDQWDKETICSILEVTKEL